VLMTEFAHCPNLLTISDTGMHYLTSQSSCQAPETGGRVQVINSTVNASLISGLCPWHVCLSALWIYSADTTPNP